MQDDKYAVFAAWAPPNSPWSRWVTPSMLAQISRGSVNSAVSGVRLQPFQSTALASPCHRCALVVDLPGPEAVIAGLILAQQGYRPVPLFNSCPPDIDDTVA